MKSAKCIFAALFGKYNLALYSNVKVLISGQLCQAKGASSYVLHQLFRIPFMQWPKQRLAVKLKPAPRKPNNMQTTLEVFTKAQITRKTELNRNFHINTQNLGHDSAL